MHVCCPQVKTLSLFVSIGWCVYNSIPPYLLLHYWAWGHKGLRWTSTIASLVSTLVAIFIIIMIWLVLPNSYDFGKVGDQWRAPVCQLGICWIWGTYEAASICIASRSLSRQIGLASSHACYSENFAEQ